jgi:hypothetical protein
MILLNSVMKSSLQLKDLLLFITFSGLTTIILFVSYYVFFKQDIEEDNN